MDLKIIPFSDLNDADLFVDAVYKGGSAGNTGDDPLSKLMGVGNQGGFRFKGDSSKSTYSIIVIYSSLLELDWPDTLDLETGLFYYYGDNRRPGRALHETTRKGNKLLADIFHFAHGGPDRRQRVPPIFIFSKFSKGRDVVFRGLAVPGGKSLSQTEDLVAVWKIKGENRFQNYRAVFTILDEPTISRNWINDLHEGRIYSEACPKSYRDWVKYGSYNPLLASKTIDYRKKDDQLPQTKTEKRIIGSILAAFQSNHYAFEKCAAAIVGLMDSNIKELELTRPHRDGGRDAIGKYEIGIESNTIKVEFAMEAKCYAPDTSVGVKEMSRLISRLRHRQFGILVTTSYVGLQAYKEIISDSHPVIILSGRDIARILRLNSLNRIKQLEKWLEQFI